MNRKSYPTDLTDEQWNVLKPLIPSAKSGGRPRKTDAREVINAIFYLLRTGCAWRLAMINLMVRRLASVPVG